MSRNTPIARLVRTFLASIGGYAVSWASIDWFTDYRSGATIVTLNLIAAGLAGAIAYLQALNSSKPRTTFGKALYTFGQNLVPGLSTIALTELTTFALVNVGRAIVSTAIGAVVAALMTLGLNASEDATPKPEGR